MCEKAWSKWHRSDFSESARADSGNEGMAFQTCPDDGFTSEGKPSDARTNYFLTQLREELGEIRKAFEPADNAVSLALASVCNLERHIAAQEKKPRETVRSPETSNKTAIQQIAELRKSLEDESPRAAKNSSSFEEELVLVRPVKGVDEEDRLILGDPKILSARALKS